MNNQEAKFILGAYRADGRDATDPVFADALAQAQLDPALAGWLERERAFDATIGRKLLEIQPPAGLREAILAGSRASRRRDPWWNRHAILAAAAAVAVLLALTLVVRRHAALTPDEFARFALHDLARDHAAHVGHPPGLDALQVKLATAAAPLPAVAKLDLDQLRHERCRTIHFAGREVFELCFNRNGEWFHLYAARRSDFAPGSLAPTIASEAQFAAATWADTENVYALVTSAGPAALRPLI